MDEFRYARTRPRADYKVVATYYPYLTNHYLRLSLSLSLPLSYSPENFISLSLTACPQQTRFTTLSCNYHHKVDFTSSKGPRKGMLHFALTQLPRTSMSNLFNQKLLDQHLLPSTKPRPSCTVCASYASRKILILNVRCMFRHVLPSATALE